jgi:hypothetical protein
MVSNEYVQELVAHSGAPVHRLASHNPVPSIGCIIRRWAPAAAINKHAAVARADQQAVGARRAVGTEPQGVALGARPTEE